MADEFVKPLGGLLIGAFLNTHAFGLVTYQFAAYHNAKYEDKIWVKTMVALLFCLDTFHSAEIVYMIWLFCVQNFDRPDLIKDTLWPLTITPLITSCSAFITHSYLAYCIYKTTDSRRLLVLLVALSIIDLGVGIACGAKSTTSFSLPELPVNRFLQGAWLVVDAVVNAVFCAILVWEFLQGRWTAKERDEGESTWWTVAKLGMRSGVIIFAISLLVVVIFGAAPSSSYLHAIFALSMGRIYSNCVLAELGSRRSIVQFQEPVYTTNAIEFAKYADTVRQSMHQVNQPGDRESDTNESDSRRQSRDGKFVLHDDRSEQDAIQQVKRDI
ncbi:hypothetical protein HGRIS_009852 [Hohenbuehelia grisea]|uniref:Uncharacterized protein n=1 Tax=Hohenbuehelia grisea TaxID=104357 RepID=A0ABR3J2T6_9AGAR